jgi:methanogenic corrinoid protein MtbC1
MALIEKLILPTIRELSHLVDVGQVSISQEHIVSSLIKELLYRILSKIEPPAARPRGSKRQFVLATPEGDFHEIGFLLGHILIRHYGHTSLYLGPNTPSKAIAETALRFEGTDILIVATTSKKDGANDDTLNYLSQIRKIVDRTMRIFLAGAQAHVLPQAEFNNFCRIQDFRNFKTELENRSTQK